MLLSIQNEILPLNSKTKMKNIKFKLQDSFMVTPASGKKKEKNTDKRITTKAGV